MHKSDAGALVLGLAADEDVRRAFKQVLAAVASRAPDAAVDGVLVQEMVSEGVEILVGMKRDPVFGPAIVVSPGGVFVELFEGASQVRLAPLSIEEAEAMVKRSRRDREAAGRISRASAGRPIRHLSSFIVDFSRFVEGLDDCVVAVDLNPVMVLPRGPWRDHRRCRHRARRTTGTLTITRRRACRPRPCRQPAEPASQP